MALAAILLCVNFTSCSKDDGPIEEENEEVDFTGYTSTNLKISGKTFWIDEDYCDARIYDWGDDERDFDFLFQGRTEDMDWVRISLTEILPIEGLSNKNIANYIYLYGFIEEEEDQYLYYDYSRGKISAKIENGTLKVNFENVVYEVASETKDTRTLNGSISYNFK